MPSTCVAIRRFGVCLQKSTFLLVALFFACAHGQIVTTLAGRGSANPFSDGAGTQATFNQPSGVAAASGNVVVADTGNNRIRRVTFGGVVSTLAGNGSAMFADGTGWGATFNKPTGVATDLSGNVVVADSGNNRVRKVTPGGVVITLAGNGTPTFSDGTGAGASFNLPLYVAIDASGSVFVADTGNYRIRKVAPGGIVTTLAGSGSAAFVEGTGAGASFSPYGVAVDASGNVIVAARDNNRVLKVAPGGGVTTLAGSGSYAFEDGFGTGASFRFPVAVTIDASSNVFVTDWGNNRVRKVSPQGVVSALAGGRGGPGPIDGTNAGANFYQPWGVTVNASGSIFVTDAYVGVVLMILPCPRGTFVQPTSCGVCAPVRRLSFNTHTLLPHS